MARVTLSFDNGPDPEHTPHVLDALAAHDVRATFFTVGNLVARPGMRALLERARDAGHWIGNHGYTHGTPLGIDVSPEAARHEIVDTQALLGSLLHPDLPFRPFGCGQGELDATLLSRAALEQLVAGRHTLVLWNCIPREWEGPAWVARALAEIASRDWSLVLVHDVLPETPAHLPEFLDALHAAGHEIVQEWPESCVPIHRGIVRDPVDALIGG